MTSYFDDHNIKPIKKKNQDENLNPNTISTFFQEESLESLQLSGLEFFRNLQQIHSNNDNIDNIITQLMDQDNLKKGNPPISKKFLSKLYFSKPQNDDCPICTEKFLGTVIKLPCNHEFHKDCIWEWFKLKNTCPIDRTDFPTDDLDYEKKMGRLDDVTSKTAVEEEEDEDPIDSMYG